MHVFINVLPGTPGDHRVGGGQVGARELEIQMRLTMRLEPGTEKLGRFAPVAGSKACLFAGLRVVNVIDASIATIKTESMLHRLL